MSNIDPQIAQQIVQFLATYGTPAGIAAAQTIGTSTAQAFGSGTMKVMKSLWGKIRHQSKQEGDIAEEAITAFEAAPHELEHQQTLSFILKQLCSKDSAFADEITQLFNEVQRDPIAERFIQHISGNAHVGIAGLIYGPVTIHQTSHQPHSLRPAHQLEIDLTYVYLAYPRGYIDRNPALVVSAMNTGSEPSYVSHVEFESRVDGRTQTHGVVYPAITLMARQSNKFGEAIQPGQKHQYWYYLPDLADFGTLGREVIPIAILVFDEIKNTYRKLFTDEMCRTIMKYFRSED